MGTKKRDIWILSKDLNSLTRTSGYIKDVWQDVPLWLRAVLLLNILVAVPFVAYWLGLNSDWLYTLIAG